MRFEKYITEQSGLKAGDWVEGEVEGIFSSMKPGILICRVDSYFHLMATWSDKKKYYVRIPSNTLRKAGLDKNAPKSLMLFAKKHSMWGLGL